MSQDSSFDSQLTGLLLRWEELRDQGRKVTAEELCEDCPELAEELERRIRALQSIDQQLGELRQRETSQATMAWAGETPAPLAQEPVTIAARYGDLQLHARGGLGEVFVARDEELGRDVALKFIQQHQLQDPYWRGRFLLEAEVTGQLDHPGVVPIYGLGESWDGRPFYVMRFIRGMTLDDAIEQLHAARKTMSREQWRLELQGLIRHFIAACNTIAYAHSRGIVHCDIKPQNVMLGKYGETLVVDWGLAMTVVRDEFTRTSAEQTLRPRQTSPDRDSGGVCAGTPAFMSPEQITPAWRPLGPASDVYSLGATLYKLVTARTPFQKNRLWDWQQEPLAMGKEIPGALQAICCKAMQLEPSDRYATAKGLAHDLQQWLADAPVAVYREPRGERLMRWARQHRQWAQSIAAAVLLILVVVAVAAVVLARVAESERGARRAAEQARDQVRQLAAQFAARTVANESDLRWRILEAEAADADFHQILSRALAQPFGTPERNALQDWIEARAREHAAPTRATSWFVTDGQGTQLARSPFNSYTVGRNYAFRDYFHGRGPDLSPEQAVGIEPIQRPYRSASFRSQATHNPMVAFSVPVWSGRPEASGSQVLGVLAMTVELGNFAVLQVGLDQDHIAVLADLRDDWEGARGTILHHPGLDPKGPPPRLDPQRVALLDALRQESLQRGEQFVTRDPEYQDPIGGDYEGRWLAAFAPVLVKGRPLEIQDTGWVVIVQERAAR